MRLIAVAGILVFVSALPVAAQSSAPKPYNPPRTTDGKPDVQGIWQARNTAADNLEDHEASLGIPAAKGVIADPPDGKIPYQPWAAAKRKDLLDNHRCDAARG